MLPQLLTIEEAAEYLRVSRRHLYKLIAAGDLVTVRIGHRRVITDVALADYLAEHAEVAS